MTFLFINLLLYLYNIKLLNMKLFESISNSLLNESLGEVIVNPNDTSKNVFDYKCRDNNLYIFANVDSDDLKKISEIDQSLIKGKWARIIIPLKDLQSTDSEGYRKLSSFCEIINNLGKYGTFTPEQLIDDAGQYIKDRVRPETAKEITQSEDELFNELINKFGEPRIKELLQSLKKHTNIPVKGLDNNMSVKNIMRILSQDSKRIAAGKPAATYVAKPDDWRVFNRQINRDAMPIYLWYKVSASNPSDKAIDQGATNIYGSEKGNILKGRTATQTLNDFMKGGSKTLGPARGLKYAAQKVWNTNNRFEIGPYYDISDTSVIPGLEDKFNDPERIGFVNNIKMVPTQASLNKVVNDKGQSVEDLLRDELGGTDDKCTIDVYNALRRIFRKQDSIPVGQDGKPDMDGIRKSVYDTIVDYLANNNKEMLSLYAKPETRTAIAQVIACLYMSIHRIAPEILIKTLYDGVNQNDLQQEAEKARFTTRNVYNSLANMIEAEVLRGNSDATQVQQNNQSNKKIMEESTNNMIDPLDAIKRAWGIEDNTLNNAPDDGINLTNEERKLTEAKFYSVLNKMNNTKF